MNFYQSVCTERDFFENIFKKGGFGVITLLYLPFLVRAIPSKIFYSNLFYSRLLYSTNLWSCKEI